MTILDVLHTNDILHRTVCTRHTAINIATSIISCKKALLKSHINQNVNKENSEVTCRPLLMPQNMDFFFNSVRINKKPLKSDVLIHVAIADAETDSTEGQGRCKHEYLLQ